ncbi:hypothetical protein Vretifemale_11233 [Volvox reticuliferus]|uniref:Inositol polyphosphate-related phosphatase domain-containing protein n=1 Tax=Volvox reticuliferus TaxID=1737510 RepID=A0A8J4CL56_9CHLO|nr:hypothetical protein Vretifemale_11233 [Volvox reticuliferus]
MSPLPSRSAPSGYHFPLSPPVRPPLSSFSPPPTIQGFLEMPIAFAPTFKFFRNSDKYDLRRAPSWTDRVLYLVNADPLFADLRPLYYMSVPELRTSDHKPVIAGFELSICPLRGGDNRHARQRGCVVM